MWHHGVCFHFVCLAGTVVSLSYVVEPRFGNRFPSHCARHKLCTGDLGILRNHRFCVIFAGRSCRVRVQQSIHNSKWWVFEGRLATGVEAGSVPAVTLVSCGACTSFSQLQPTVRRQNTIFSLCNVSLWTVSTTDCRSFFIFKL